MRVRPAAVAGSFYPDNASELATLVDDLLSRAKASGSSSHPSCKALIVPHAGYIYSGLTAASAYAAVDAESIQRVVLFGPSHRVAFYGMTVPEADRFHTPLGDVVIDQELLAEALMHAQVQPSDYSQAMEHSLEVQLPFLQRVLGHFTLLPICVGKCEPETAAELMASYLQQPGTLLLVSSDLSHFHAYDDAVARDHASIDKILSLDTGLDGEAACGATAVNGLMIAVKAQGLTPILLDYRNSGDTAGDKQRVVGYASIGWYARAC